MNMYMHELRAYKKSTFIWTCSLIALVALMMAIFPAFSSNVVEAKKVLQAYPEAVRKALGISLDSLSSLLGFYSFVFVYVLLCGAIQAMNLGTSILSKEVREKTADFLFIKPVSRRQIMTSKLLAAITALGITNLFYIAAASTTASIVKTSPYDFKIFLMVSLTLFLIQLMFLSLGVIIAVAFRKIRSALSVSIGTVFAFFILGMLASITGDTAMNYLIPFKYFEAAQIIKTGSYEISYIFVEVAFVVAAILTGYLVYIKKDIHTV